MMNRHSDTESAIQIINRECCHKTEKIIKMWVETVDLRLGEQNTMSDKLYTSSTYTSYTSLTLYRSYAISYHRNDYMYGNRLL